MATALKLMYSADFIRSLSQKIKKQYPDFDSKKFESHFTTTEWKNAELKARVSFIARRLQEHLPSDYKKAIDILIPVSQTFDTGYAPIFFPEFVDLFGHHDWDTSMRALSIFTQSSSAEFAIRSFILENPEKAMAQMETWSTDANHHIRRLSSEGCRPILPWGKKLHLFVNDPSPAIPILERLKNDPSEYVRKSVANHLNDISKSHPQLALDLSEKWIGQSENTDRVIKHALRTLLKKGNQRALALFGFSKKYKAAIEGLSMKPSKISIGEAGHLQFELHQKESLIKLRLEYQIHFIKPSGIVSKKVFQLSEKEWERGVHSIIKKHPFHDMTTRTHAPGKHQIDVLINGEVCASSDFHLK